MDEQIFGDLTTSHSECDNNNNALENNIEKIFFTKNKNKKNMLKVNITDKNIEKIDLSTFVKIINKKIKHKISIEKKEILEIESKTLLINNELLNNKKECKCKILNFFSFLSNTENDNKKYMLSRLNELLHQKKQKLNELKKLYKNVNILNAKTLIWLFPSMFKNLIIDYCEFNRLKSCMDKESEKRKKFGKDVFISICENFNREDFFQLLNKEEMYLLFKKSGIPKSVWSEITKVNMRIRLNDDCWNPEYSKNKPYFNYLNMIWGFAFVLYYYEEKINECEKKENSCEKNDFDVIYEIFNCCAF